MIDFRDDDLFWDIVFSSVIDYDLSWSIVTSDGLYWSIADMESIFHGSIVALFGSFTLGCIHLLEGDQIDSWSLEHLTSDMGINGLFHIVLIAYWGMATLLEVLTLRLDFLFVIVAYDGLWSCRHLGFSFLGILGWSQISPYLSFHTQTFHPWYFRTFYLTRAWSSPYFILHIPPWHMTSLFLD